MTTPRRRGERLPWSAIADAVLFLFLLQLITEYIAAVYAFGLLGTSIPAEIASVVLLFAPAVLLVWPREMKRAPYLALAGIMLVSRPVAVLLGTRARMLVSGVGVAAGLIWFPALLWRLGQADDAEGPCEPGVGLMLAVMAAVVFRTWGSGLDLSARGPFQVVGWALAGVAAFALVRPMLAGARTRRRATSDSAPRAFVPVLPDGEADVDLYPAAGLPSADGRLTGRKPVFGRLVALAVGLNSALVLLYYAFASPNVIARWTGASYPGIVIALALGVVLGAGLGSFRPRRPSGSWMTALWAANAVFVLALCATLWPHQLRFPADPGGYAFYVPATSPVWNVPLYVMLVLLPVLFVDFDTYAQEVVAARPSLRALGGAFTVGAVYLLVMIFAHVFTTVYDYIPIVGPALRDRFWVVHLVAGLGLALPLFAVRRPLAPRAMVPRRRWVATVVLALALLAVAGMFVTRAQPGEAVGTTTLKVLTYNIQQGYGADSQLAADRQLALMRAVDADIIGLQESDTNRIAGGNADLVRYYADSLDMYSYYGPTTVAGTFGIALLSKVPIEAPRTFYMYSEGEQTATIEAQVTVGGQTYHVFVTHLGNGGPIVQQVAILEVVAGLENVVLVGDFNFRPETDQYALTTALLDDAWLRRWPDGVDDEGYQPPKRIDHVFISPSLQVDDVRYIDDPASDHPAVTAIVRP